MLWSTKMSLYMGYVVEVARFFTNSITLSPSWQRSQLSWNYWSRVWIATKLNGQTSARSTLQSYWCYRLGYCRVGSGKAFLIMVIVLLGFSWLWSVRMA